MSGGVTQAMQREAFDVQSGFHAIGFEYLAHIVIVHLAVFTWLARNEDRFIWLDCCKPARGCQIAFYGLPGRQGQLCCFHLSLLVLASVAIDIAIAPCAIVLNDDLRFDVPPCEANNFTPSPGSPEIDSKQSAIPNAFRSVNRNHRKETL